MQPLSQHIAAKSTDLRLSKNTRFSEIAVKGANSPIEAFSLLRDIIIQNQISEALQAILERHYFLA